VIGPLRQRWAAAVAGGRWDGAASLRRNMEACLGAALPLAASAGSNAAGDATGGGLEGDGRHGFSAECAICYTHRLTLPIGGGGGHGGHSGSGASSLPEVLCANGKCGRSYHERCLGEWLRGLPTATRSFDTVFGYCPYCFVPISVKAA